MAKMYKQIIGIIGAPRSGTSWTGQIFDSAPGVLFRMQPFYSYAFRDKIHVRSSTDEVREFFEEMYYSDDDYLAQKERKEKGVYPVFADKNKSPQTMVFKEVMFHYMVPVILEHMPELSIIAIVRHPIDILTSYYNAPREFDPQLNIYDEWYFAQSRNELLPERYFGYHKWKEYMMIVECVKNKYGDRVNILRYEDLVKDTENVVKRLFLDNGIEFTPQTTQFLFDCVHKNNDDPYSVFRGSKKEKKQLPDDIKEAIHVDLTTFSIAKKYGYH